MSNAIRVIVRREYLTRVTTKSFWIGTALFPLVILVGAMLPSVIAERAKGSSQPIVVLDRVGGFYSMVEASQRDLDVDKRHPLLRMPNSKVSDVASLTDLNRRVESGDIQGYVVIDSRAVGAEGIVIYSARNPSSLVINERLAMVIRSAITRYRLMQAGASAEQVAAVSHKTRFDIRKATNDQGRQAVGRAGLFVAFGLVLGMYVSLTMYGTQILRGVLEEKSNRIIEVIISAVKPTDLMAGKILGIGAVGLTQVCIWSVCAFVLTAPGMWAALSLSPGQISKMTPAMVVWLPIYFVLGYLLYSTVFAAIGACFNSEEEAQQLAVVAHGILALPMVLFLPVLSNPSSRLAVTLSLIPFLSPTLMYLRIVTETPPGWQVALSVVLILVTTVAMVWLASKIYRVGILMYGKKPTIPEIMRWVRYS